MFTEEEKKFILKNDNRMSIKQIADRLKKTPKEIVDEYERLIKNTKIDWIKIKGLENNFFVTGKKENGNDKQITTKNDRDESQT